jgi:NADH-quinone oxidoreductase subunit N
VTWSYAELARALLPEAALVVGVLAVLGIDLVWLRERSTARRLRIAVGVAAVAVVAALVAAAREGGLGPVVGGALTLDALAVAARVGVLGLALLTLGVATAAPAPRHPAEYVAIVLFATAGLTLMSAAQQLLIAFLALELASLSLYVLAGFDKEGPESAEAALKYFLFGGMSSAFLLFGFSLIYGLTGSIELPEIAAALGRQGFSPLLAVALVMVLVAFGFKVAAAPFHLWAPDAYQGAPTASAALIASGSKLAGFVLFARLLWPALGTAAGASAALPGGRGWFPAVALMAGASLLLGNLVALVQRNVRRLLAYSAIAHAGALLLGVLALGGSGPAPLFYYAATYALAALGAFGVIAGVERGGGCARIEDLAGLVHRSPFLAACLAVFILSLAGIPPLAGFFGKLGVFVAAFRLAGLGGPAGWLGVLAIVLSAVALYYYLLVLKQALVAAPAPGVSPIAVPRPAALALAGAAGLVVLLGVFPSLLLGRF